MTEQDAREILKEWVQPNDTLRSMKRYLSWPDMHQFSDGDEMPQKICITLDDKFTLTELKAIVWWMENKIKPKRVV